MSDFIFVAQAQNYVNLAEFSTNHLLSIELPVVTVTKNEWQCFV